MSRALLTVWLALAALACREAPITRCEGYVCPGELACHPGGQGCVDPAQLTSCRGAAPHTPCSYPGVATGACQDGVCEPDESCGNGVIDFARGESCDDGNLASGDGCSSGCALERPTWTHADGGWATAEPSYSLAYDATRGRIVLVTGYETKTFQTWEWDGLDWARVAATYEDPLPRQGSALAYDAARRRVLMFGGLSEQALALFDTWEFDGRRWIDRNPAKAPAKRWQHALAYDAARHRIVLFGGRPEYTTPTAYGDTWEWDGSSWTEVTPTGASPSPRSGAAMAYDARRGRVVLIGGESNGMLLDDVWEWDGRRWIDVTPPSPRPEPRSLAAASYDPALGIILTGGREAATDNDVPPASVPGTWAWDGARWTQLASTSPHDLPAAVYDSARGRTIAIASTAATQPTVSEWSGLDWVKVSPEPLSPSTRVFMAGAYDPVRHRAVLFGGSWDGKLLTDTWEWDGFAWHDVTPELASPPGRTNAAMAYDGIRHRVLLFGGLDPGDHLALADTWAWDGSHWLQVTPPSGSPPPRAFHAMATAADGSVVLFGGQDPSLVDPPSLAATSDTDDTWVWDGSSWTEMTPATSPPARRRHQMARDDQDRVILFGGWQSLPTGERYLGDTWGWDGTSWTQLATSGDAPSARGYFGLAQGIDGELVLFGGTNEYDKGEFGVFNDTWTWSENRWVQRPAAPGPAARMAHLMFNALPSDGPMLFGGGDPTSNQPFGDTWNTDDARRWRDVSPVNGVPNGCLSPALAYDSRRGEIVMFDAIDNYGQDIRNTFVRRGGGWQRRPTHEELTARKGAAMAYDAARDRVVLFGGLIEYIGYLNYTWEWDGTAWVNVSGTNGDIPGRQGGAMAYDPASGRTVLFGGNNRDGLLGDTWEWDGHTWTQSLGPGSGPSARTNAALAYDPARQRLVLFGGGGTQPGDPFPDDTWEWDGGTWIEVTPPSGSPDGRARHALVYDEARRQMLLLGGDNEVSIFSDLHEWDGSAWHQLGTPGGQLTPRTGTGVAYDAARREVVIVGGSTVVGDYYQMMDGLKNETWVMRWAAEGDQETCLYGVDGDHDGLLGCQDRDCAGWCGGCGDGSCNQGLESCRSCPQDCGTCAPRCGDLLCDPGETTASCPGDCTP